MLRLYHRLICAYPLGALGLWLAGSMAFTLCLCALVEHRPRVAAALALASLVLISMPDAE